MCNRPMAVTNSARRAMVCWENITAAAVAPVGHLTPFDIELLLTVPTSAAIRSRNRKSD